MERIPFHGIYSTKANMWNITSVVFKYVSKSPLSINDPNKEHHLSGWLNLSLPSFFFITCSSLICRLFRYLPQRGNAMILSEIVAGIMIKANDEITNDFTLVLWTGQPRFKVILCVSFSSFPTLLSSKSRSGRSLITVLLLPLLTLLTCAFLHPDPSSLILILVQGHLWHLCPTVSTHPVLLKDIFNSAAPGLFWCYPEQN